MRYMKAFAADDPFKELYKGADKDPSFGIRMQNVRVKHFDHGKLVTYANCNQLDLERGHRLYTLTGIHDAMYKGSQGTFRYAADHATYVEGIDMLDAKGNVRVKNADMDLHAREMKYLGMKKELRITGDVRGKVHGGDTVASHVVYNVDTGAYSAGPVDWKGAVALDVQEGGDQTKPRIWNIHGEDTKGVGGVNHYINATATDGEVILIAPSVDWDQHTDVLTATGRVQYFSGRANLVGDQCVVYRKEKRAVLTGHVQMLVKPKTSENDPPKVEQIPAFQPLNPDQVVAQTPAQVNEEVRRRAEKVRDSKSIRDYPMAIVSDKIEYWYGKGSRRAVITGSPQGRQELPDAAWRHLWANVAYYDGENETLKLVSTKGKKDTHMKNSIGDDMVAEWMEVSTKEDDDQLSGHAFEGSLTSLDEDDTSRKSMTKRPGAGGPGGGKPPEKPPVTTGTGTPPPKTGN